MRVRCGDVDKHSGSHLITSEWDLRDSFKMSYYFEQEPSVVAKYPNKQHIGNIKTEYVEVKNKKKKKSENWAIFPRDLVTKCLMINVIILNSKTFTYAY